MYDICTANLHPQLKPGSHSYNWVVDWSKFLAQGETTAVAEL